MRNSLASLVAILTLAPSSPTSHTGHTGSHSDVSDEIDRIFKLYKTTLHVVAPQPVAVSDSCVGPKATLIVPNTVADADSKRALIVLFESLTHSLLDGSCSPESTLLAFDIDETVLVPSGGTTSDPVFAIRQSPKIIAQIQALGVSTLAVTARDAVPPEYGPRYLMAQAHKLRAKDMTEQMGLDREVDQFINEESVQVQRDLTQAQIHVSSGVSAFQNVNGTFFDSQGRPAAEGFFQLGSEEAPVWGSPASLSQTVHYSNGVLMASHKGKGRVLSEFLKKKGLYEHYKCLYFVDDDADNIQAMAETFQSTLNKKVHLFKVPNPLIINGVGKYGWLDPKKDY